jgi:hypothetical protein
VAFAKRRERKFVRLLTETLNNSDQKFRSHFYLFEESPFWYAMAHEVIKNKSAEENLTVFIFGNSVRTPMVNQKAWIKFQGGFFSNWNLVKYVVRGVLPKLLHNRRPSVVLHKTLKNSNVMVVDFSKLRFPTSTFGPESYKLNILFNDVATSLISELASTEYVTEYFSEQYIKERAQSGIAVHQVISKLILNLYPSKIYYMNGRMLHERAALEAARGNDIKSFAIESNMYGNKIQEVEVSIANQEFMCRSMTSFWEKQVIEFGLERTLNRASMFFEERFTNRAINPFLARMNQLPKLDSAKGEIYTYFTSSNEEMKALYSLYSEPSFDQQGLIVELIKTFSLPENYNKTLVIKVHPNLQNKKSEDKKFFEQIKESKNIKIYNYDSHVNAYELLKVSDFVLYSSSTVGLEAAYFKVPTFNFAKTFWDDLNVSKKLTAVTDLFHQTPLDLEEAHLQSLKYGLFTMDGGLEYRHTNIKRMSDIHGKYYFDSLNWLLFKVLRSGQKTLSKSTVNIQDLG